jgi:hypothetical protein
VLFIAVRSNRDYFSVQFPLTDFITEKYSVYCAVRTESLNIIQVNFVLKGLKELDMIRNVFKSIRIVSNGGVSRCRGDLTSKQILPLCQYYRFSNRSQINV